MLTTTKTQIDGRISRTRDRLGDALIELVKEKGFEAVDGEGRTGSMRKSRVGSDSMIVSNDTRISRQGRPVLLGSGNSSSNEQMRQAS